MDVAVAVAVLINKVLEMDVVKVINKVLEMGTAKDQTMDAVLETVDSQQIIQLQITTWTMMMISFYSRH